MLPVLSSRLPKTDLPILCRSSQHTHTQSFHPGKSLLGPGGAVHTPTASQAAGLSLLLSPVLQAQSFDTCRSLRHMHMQSFKPGKSLLGPGGAVHTPTASQACSLNSSHCSPAQCFILTLLLACRSSRHTHTQSFNPGKSLLGPGGAVHTPTASQAAGAPSAITAPSNTLLLLGALAVVVLLQVSCLDSSHTAQSGSLASCPWSLSACMLQSQAHAYHVSARQHSGSSATCRQ